MATLVSTTLVAAVCFVSCDDEEGTGVKSKTTSETVGIKPVNGRAKGEIVLSYNDNDGTYDIMTTSDFKIDCKRHQKNDIERCHQKKMCANIQDCSATCYKCKWN